MRRSPAAGLVLLCVLWNMMGARAVGESSVVVGVLLLSPFVLLTLFALLLVHAMQSRTQTLGSYPGLPPRPISFDTPNWAGYVALP